MEETASEQRPSPSLTRIEDPAEMRILGSLMEKEMTTPAYYPMTVNALTAACNQKNNRDPVVEFDEQTVVKGLEGLRKKMLVSCVTGAGYRVQKYKHNAAQVYALSRGESAILCLLLLRGPQTPGEVRSRSGSMHPFASLEEVEAVLQTMMNRQEPLAKKLSRITGQKESRFAHLLAGEPLFSGPADTDATEGPGAEERISQLEHRTADLELEIVQLKALFAEFRKQFE